MYLCLNYGFEFILVTMGECSQTCMFKRIDGFYLLIFTLFTGLHSDQYNPLPTTL